MIQSNGREWFSERIGKVVYGSKTGCNCRHCDRAYTQGILIRDEMTADYISEYEFLFNLEGTPLKYFDTIDERAEFEKNIESKNKVV